MVTGIESNYGLGCAVAGHDQRTPVDPLGAGCVRGFEPSIPAHSLSMLAEACDARLGASTVYVSGVLYEEYGYGLDTPCQAIEDALRTGHEKLRCSWRSNGVTLGGFPAHAARAARQKRQSVAIGAVVPNPRPPVLERFLEDYAIDRSYLRPTVAGPMPHVLRLRMANGHLLVVDQAGGSYAPPLPDTDFDVILLNGGGPDARRGLIAQLRARPRSDTTVGLLARGDWTTTDWELVKGTGYRVFLNAEELAQSLARAATGDPLRDVIHLRERIPGLCLAVTLGAGGSLVCDERGPVWRIASVPLGSVPGDAVGAGDTFAMTATLAGAAGMPAPMAARWASADAARVVAGESPAQSFRALEETLAAMGRSEPKPDARS